MGSKATIRDRIEQTLRAADPEEWFTHRELAERINAKVSTVRAVVLVMRQREQVLEKSERASIWRNPSTGTMTENFYRWKR